MPKIRPSTPEKIRKWREDQKELLEKKGTRETIAASEWFGAFVYIDRSCKFLLSLFLDIEEDRKKQELRAQALRELDVSRFFFVKIQIAAIFRRPVWLPHLKMAQNNSKAPVSLAHNFFFFLLRICIQTLKKMNNSYKLSITNSKASIKLHHNLFLKFIFPFSKKWMKNEKNWKNIPSKICFSMNYWLLIAWRIFEFFHFLKFLQTFFNLLYFFLIFQIFPNFKKISNFFHFF